MKRFTIKTMFSHSDFQLLPALHILNTKKHKSPRLIPKFSGVHHRDR